MVELRQRRVRDTSAQRRKASERGREFAQLEHVPENRMMMIQYFPVRGQSVHSLPTKSPFSISAALLFSPLMQKSICTL